MFSDNVSTIKIAALLLLAIVKLVAGFGPVVFLANLRGVGHNRMNIYASLSLCIGGGVLLASCMLHMIPEVRESVSSVLPNATFPFAEFLVCCGLFLVYVIDETLNIFTEPEQARSVEADLRLTGKVAPIQKLNNDAFKKNGFGKDTLVLIAMTLHSSLEGFALGIQTMPNSVGLLFTAIVLHSSVVLFSFGLKLIAENKTDSQIAIFMCSLALSTPLGGALGLTAVFNDHSPNWVVIALKGIAAGSLLHVTFFEVLNKEKNKKGFIRLLLVLFGFSVTAVFQFFAGHCHTCSGELLKTNSSKV